MKKPNKGRVTVKNLKFKRKQKKRFVTKLNSNVDNLKQLSIVHINAKSAVNKLDELEALADFARAHILCITETWFSDNMTYTMHNFENVVSLHCNNTNNTSGGAAIYVRRDVVHNFRMINIKSKSSLDSQIIGIESTKFNLTIFCCYRSPSQTRSCDIQYFLDDVEQLNLSEANEWIFLGDINCPTGYGPGFEANDGKVSGPYKKIVDYFEDLVVEQPICEATHIGGNTLDIFWCSSFIDIEKSGVYSSYHFDSDHYPVYLTIKLEHKLTKKVVELERQVPDWDKADLKGYEKEMFKKQNKLCEMANCITNNKMDVHKAAILINEEIITTWNKFVPTKWVVIDDQPFSKETKEQIRKLRGISKSSHRRSREVREESRKLSAMIKVDKKVKAQKRLDRIVADHRHIYTYFKKSRRGENRIGPFVNPNTKKLTECDQEACDLLSIQYKSVWPTNAKIDIDPYSYPDWWHPPMEDYFDFEGIVEVEDYQLLSALSDTKRRVGTVTGGVTGWMIKEAINPLLQPLTLLINNMTRFGEWPDIYKIGDVHPLRKPGPTDDLSNTRPIVLNELIGKSFEKTLVRKFIKHIRHFANGRFNIKENQFGFYPNRCVQDNLLMTINKINCILESGKTCDVVYLDIRKGFDSLSFQHMAQDLKNSGIVGKTLELWIGWMTNRKQRVKINDAFSEYVDITGSCAQGSSCGPSFFLSYINEAIPDDMGPNGKLKKDNTESERQNESSYDKRHRIVNGVSVFSYADDSKCLASSDNHEGLQAVLDGFQDWADRKGMKFNVKKSFCLYIGRNNPKHKYYMGGEQLEESDSVRDLGLYYRYDEKRNQLCYLETLRKRMRDCNTIIKCTRNIISIRRNTINEFVRAYQTYIFPQLYTFSEFYFFETEDECKIVDEVLKVFFSNLVFSVSDLKSFPFAPSAVLKKLARIRFWRVANSLTGADPYDLFTFIGDESDPRSVIQYPRLMPDYKRVGNSRAEALCRTPSWRLIPWYNNSVPHDEIGRYWYKFKNWIETDEYILTELHTKDATDLRHKIVNGHFSNVRQRRLKHISDSQEATATEIERQFQEACSRIRVPITPMRTQFHKIKGVSTGPGIYLVPPEEGDVIEIGGITIGGAVSLPAKNQNKATLEKENKGDAHILPPTSAVATLHFKDLEPFEDGLIEDSIDQDDELQQREEDAGNKVIIPGYKVPARRARAKESGHKSKAGDNLSSLLYP